MITKQLTMIYVPHDKDHDDCLNTVTFKSYKELHMHLFENGLYPEFQVYEDGLTVIHYRSNKDSGAYSLEWNAKVPGSVLFEIVNKHASAQLN